MEERGEGRKPRTLRDDWDDKTERAKKFLKKVFHYGTLACIPLWICMVVIGITFFGSCPAQNFLPVYLIVSGMFCLGFLTLKGCTDCCCLDEDDKRPYVVNSLLFLTCILIIAWFVAGSVWVYSLYDNFSTDIRDKDFCNSVLYIFSFYLLSLTNGLIAILLITTGIWYLFKVCLKCSSDD